MPTQGPDIDGDDTKEWSKPTRQKGLNDGVPQSRDISKQVERESNKRKNQPGQK